MAADTTLAEALADPAIRRAVVAELRERALEDNSNGDRALAIGRYSLANANWMTAAQRQIAAHAIDTGKDVAKAAKDLVESAYAAVRTRQSTAGGAQ